MYLYKGRVDKYNFQIIFPFETVFEGLKTTNQTVYYTQSSFEVPVNFLFSYLYPINDLTK